MVMAYEKINQHGYVVADAEKSALRYFELVGAGPFYCGDFTLENYRYRGVERHCQVRIVIGHWGPLQLELIQPLDAAATLYSDALPASDGLLNHFSMPVADLAGWLAERKLTERVIQSGEMQRSGVKFVYLENMFPGGIHLEVVQAPSATLDMYAAIESASYQWDRRNPLRPMSAIPADLAAARRQ